MRYEVEAANSRRLNLLPGPSNTYKAADTPGVDIRGEPMPRRQAEDLLDRLVAVRELTLKVRYRGVSNLLHSKALFCS